MKERTKMPDEETIVFDGFSITVQDSAEFIDALDDLCSRYATTKDWEFTFKFKVVD